MFEQGEVNQAVNNLPCRPPLCALGRRLGFGSDRPHDGTGDTAVEEQPPQDQETPSPAKLLKEPRVQRCQGGEEDGAASHGESVGNGPLQEEVLPNHGEGRVQVEGQS